MRKLQRNTTSNPIRSRLTTDLSDHISLVFSVFLIATCCYYCVLLIIVLFYSYCCLLFLLVFDLIGYCSYLSLVSSFSGSTAADRPDAAPGGPTTLVQQGSVALASTPGGVPGGAQRLPNRYIGI